MSKSIKLKNDNYLDSTSIVHAKKLLSEILNNDSWWSNLNDVIKYRKRGDVMTVIGFSSGKVKLIENDYTIVGQLPKDFRPFVEIVSNWTRIGEGTVGTLKIKPDGNIELYSSSGTSYWGFTTTFIV